MHIHRTHVVAAAQTGAFHHAVKHQTLVASSRSVYQLAVPEVWYLTAWWKARVYHGTRSIQLIWLVFDIRRGGVLWPWRAVPDERYEYLCDMWKPPSQYPAYLHITDIAGRGLHSFTSELKPSLRD